MRPTPPLGSAVAVVNINTIQSKEMNAGVEAMSKTHPVPA